ncbi:hypothetical protein E3T37_15195 [Cryobacterium sp. TMT2-10]|uniref:Uncharacterized protein n=1 Tax=Cryobacterium shii TaxID=1259235 RepID=A0AAQ2C3Z7_9MICO|nr:MULTISPECIES: hypothetical protein [Cryobacterium]TFC41771.1 hypothetical protein E3O49_15395 [Cryobacterium shii]TFD35588.1 hypothetical protein E3T37_15195 [Cryobacterium sp. TMT2-10]
MKLDRITRAAYLRKPAFRSTLMAMVALAAILFSFLAMNSTHAGHETGGTAFATASGQAPDVGIVPGVGAGAGVVATGAVVAAASIAAHARIGVLGCADCVLDCAILAMTCTIVLVLASLILLARQPSLYRRLLDAGGCNVRHLSGPTLHIYRPSLTALSINRI